MVSRRVRFGRLRVAQVFLDGRLGGRVEEEAGLVELELVVGDAAEGPVGEQLRAARPRSPPLTLSRLFPIQILYRQ